MLPVKGLGENLHVFLIAHGVVSDFWGSWLADASI